MRFSAQVNLGAGTNIYFLVLLATSIEGLYLYAGKVKFNFTCQTRSQGSDGPSLANRELIIYTDRPGGLIRTCIVALESA